MNLLEGYVEPIEEVSSNPIIHIKAVNLDDQQIQSLHESIKAKAKSSKAKISLKLNQVQFDNKYIVEMAHILLNHSNNIKELHIKSKHSEGDHDNLLCLLEQFQEIHLVKLNLDLKQNIIKNVGDSELLAQAISKFTCLEELSLNFSYHKVHSCFLDFLANLKSCSQLQRVVLRYQSTDLLSPLLIKLIDNLCELKQLSSIDLSLQGRYLKDSDSQYFLKIYQHLPNLKSLKINMERFKQNNQVEGITETVNLPETIKNESLESLELSEEYLSYQVKQKPYHLGRISLDWFPNLTNLNLNLKFLREDDLIQIGTLLQSKVKLISVSLSFNSISITEVVANAFSEALQKFSNLKKLSLFLVIDDTNNNYLNLPKLVSASKIISELKIKLISYSIVKSFQQSLYDTLPHLTLLSVFKLQVFGSHRELDQEYLSKNLKKCKSLTTISFHFQVEKQEKPPIQIINLCSTDNIEVRKQLFFKISVITQSMNKSKALESLNILRKQKPLLKTLRLVNISIY